MQNITILEKSFFNSKKNPSCKKKVFGYQLFIFPKKKFDAGILSLIERKLSFSAFSVALRAKRISPSFVGAFRLTVSIQ